MKTTHHHCWRGKLRPKRVMWSYEVNRAIRPRARPPMDGSSRGDRARPRTAGVGSIPAESEGLGRHRLTPPGRCGLGRHPVGVPNREVPPVVPGFGLLLAAIASVPAQAITMQPPLPRWVGRSRPELPIGKPQAALAAKPCWDPPHPVPHPRGRPAYSALKCACCCLWLTIGAG